MKVPKVMVQKMRAKMTKRQRTNTLKMRARCIGSQFRSARTPEYLGWATGLGYAVILGVSAVTGPDPERQSHTPSLCCSQVETHFWRILSI